MFIKLCKSQSLAIEIDSKIEHFFACQWVDEEAIIDILYLRIYYTSSRWRPKAGSFLEDLYTKKEDDKDATPGNNAPYFKGIDENRS